MKKNKKLIIIISLVVITLVIGLYFYFKPTIKYKISTKEYTNSLEIEVANIKGALYSIGDEFSSNNKFTITENKEYIIKVKIGKKVLTKRVVITNIDNTKPSLDEVKVNFKDNKYYLDIVSNDDLSGIKEYIYTVNNEELKTTELITLDSLKDINLKIVDKANNIFEVPSFYYIKEIGKINYVLEPNNMTNGDVIIKVVKDSSYLEYCFNKVCGLEPNYKVVNNGNILIEVKTKEGIIKRDVNITNIDKTKPTVKIIRLFKDNKIHITVRASDNVSKNLTYYLNNNKVNNTFILDKNGTYKLKVSDEVGNAYYIDFFSYTYS